MSSCSVAHLGPTLLKDSGAQFNSNSENNSENPSELLDMSKLKIFEFFYITFWQGFGIILRIAIELCPSSHHRKRRPVAMHAQASNHSPCQGPRGTREVSLGHDTCAKFRQRSLARTSTTSQATQPRSHTMNSAPLSLSLSLSRNGLIVIAVGKKDSASHLPLPRSLPRSLR